MDPMSLTHCAERIVLLFQKVDININIYNITLISPQISSW